VRWLVQCRDAKGTTKLSFYHQEGMKKLYSSLVSMGVGNTRLLAHLRALVRTLWISWLIFQAERFYRTCV
jgi:hypothetical protein